MDAGSLLSSSVSYLQRTCNVVSQFQENKELMKTNPDLIHRVSDLAVSSQTQLKNLEELAHSHEPHMSVQCKNILQQRLENLNGRLAQVRMPLETLQQLCCSAGIMNRGRAFFDANKIERHLQEVLETLEICDGTVFQILNLVEQISNTIKDVFRPVYNVPANEGRGLTFDMSETSTTPEGQLKRILLQSCDSSETITAVDYRPHIAIPVQGLGGVGKTCALRELGWDDEIRNRFKDGIYFISFGQDSHDRKFVESIAEIVRISGGCKASEAVASAGAVPSAVTEATSWFVSRNFLIMADDIWDPTSKEDEYVNYLKRIVQCGTNARLVISTRSQKVAALVNTGKIVEFSTRRWDSEEAISILRKSAGFECQEVQSLAGELREKFNLILRKCDGLPLALAVCGNTIFDRAQECEPQSKKMVWIDYYNQTFNSVDGEDSRLSRDIPGLAGHPGLSNIISSSLEQLKRRPQTASDTADPPIADLYYSLCVLEKQQWMPMLTLSMLWGVGAKEVAYRHARALADVSLAKISRRDISGKSEAGITLHDLQHDLCTHMADKKEMVDVSHRRLLNGHRSFPPGSPEGYVRDWWSEELPSDGYLHKNLARHLIASGACDELEGLLSEYRWTERQMMLNGLGLLTDFEVMKGSFQKRITACSARYKEELESLKLRSEGISNIGRAYYISWSFLSGNKSELPTQMYGRLLSLKEGNGIIESYLCSLVRHAAKPWLRTVVPCLQAPGGKMRAKWNVPQSVRSVAPIGNGMKVVVGGLNRMLRIVDTENGDVLHELEGHANHVNDVAVTMDGKYIISGSDDRTIRLWDAESGEPVEDGTAYFSSMILSVAVSDDGSKLVYGCGDGSVGVRKVPNASESVCSMTTRVNIRRRRDHVLGCITGQSAEVTGSAHEDEVNSVALSRDGHIAVSGSCDKTLRVWDAETGHPVGDPLCGHTDHVWSVALNADASQAVSCGFDGIRVWDLQRGSMIAGPLRESEGTRSVAFSGDCRLIAAGFRNGSISVYDAISLKEAERPLRGHADWVFSMAFCRDSSRLMTGSGDYSVRVWDLEGNVDTNTAAAKGVEGPWPRNIGTAESVALSADGAFVAVGMINGTVWIFDAKGCAPKGEAMIGHKWNVSAVAFSGDGTRIASGDYVGYLMVWDVPARTAIGHPMTVPNGESEWNWVYSVAFAPDGAQIVAAYRYDTVRVWGVTDGACLQTIAHKLDRQISMKQLVAIAFPSPVDVEDTVSEEERGISIDEIYCRKGCGFWLGGAAHYTNALAFRSTYYMRSAWAFDRARDRLWALGIEGGVFVADVQK